MNNNTKDNSVKPQPDNLITNAERRYFVMLPNLIDDLGLSVYAFRLYVHMRRVAGEDGKCWQSTTTLAERCKMSAHKVVDAKRELAEVGLITVTSVDRPGGGRPYHEVVMADVWPANMAKYQGNDPAGNLQVPVGNLQVPVVQRKKNPLKKNTQKKPPKNGGATTLQVRKNGEPGRGLQSAGSLFEQMQSLIQEQGRTPNSEAINKAIAQWGLECEQAKDDGVIWKPTNRDAILERYDILTLTAPAQDHEMQDQVVQQDVTF